MTDGKYTDSLTSRIPPGRASISHCLDLTSGFEPSTGKVFLNSLSRIPDSSSKNEPATYRDVYPVNGALISRRSNERIPNHDLPCHP
jgi:hypothetical protein